MAATITSITVFDAEQLEADCELDSALGGTQGFEICRRPDFTFDQSWLAPVDAPSVLQSGSTYRVTFPSKGVWYVRLKDTAGPTYSASRAVILESTAKGFYLLAGEALRDIILANKEAIDLYIQAVQPATSPNSQLQSCHFANEWQEDKKTPTVLIKPNYYKETYEEVPNGRYVEMGYSVVGLIRVQDAMYDAKVISQLMHALVVILNQSAYTHYVVDDVPLNGGMSENHSFSDYFTGSMWVARVDTEWSWQFIRGTQ